MGLGHSVAIVLNGGTLVSIPGTGDIEQMKGRAMT
jgi:hypothetical protein